MRPTRSLFQSLQNLGLCPKTSDWYAKEIEHPTMNTESSYFDSQCLARALSEIRGFEVCYQLVESKPIRDYLCGRAENDDPLINKIKLYSEFLASHRDTDKIEKIRKILGFPKREEIPEEDLEVYSYRISINFCWTLEKEITLLRYKDQIQNADKPSLDTVVLEDIHPSDLESHDYFFLRQRIEARIVRNAKANVDTKIECYSSLGSNRATIYKVDYIKNPPSGLHECRFECISV